MKPVHAGLLIVGAALAGGLAIEMTEPQPIPVAPVPASIEVRQVAPQAPPAPAPVEPVPVKPSPWPAPNRVAAAPAPVYEEPGRVQIAKTPIRKDKPILTAKANPLIANSMPPFLPPVPYEPPAVPPRPEPKAQPEPQPEPKISPRQVTIPAGMTVQIRLNQSLSSDRGAPGDSFDASLAEPLIIDGLVIAERGSRAGGRIVDIQKGGGTSVALELTNLVTADGQKIAISTDPWTRRGDAPRAEDAAKIGGGAALGAIIGAVAGGGKGAAMAPELAEPQAWERSWRRAENR